METNLTENNINELTQKICETCHQPILPTYYFCPNCGAKINSTPLATGLGTQLGIYLFSIILPLICFLFITRWPGLKYFRSKDPKAKLIGEVAWTLLILSTIIIIWLAYAYTQGLIKSVNDSLNAANLDMSNLSF